MNFIGTFRFLLLLLLLSTVALRAVSQESAEAHHQRGVAFHDRRALDDASREYARTLALDPPRELTAAEWLLVQRFAPRLYTTPDEFFPLRDFAVIVHPSQRLIAYHLFWEDDIDFPEDNDPCDHELIWVQYAADQMTIEQVWAYFHGRILSGGEAALSDARRHGMRPRVNVQWGKHGSLLPGWEEMTILDLAGDAERKAAAPGQSVTLRQYNKETFHRLSRIGRRLPDHPIGVRLKWPRKFTGSWADFVNFSRLVDPLITLRTTRLARVSRWNSATINQHFLPYNFRPKTEWPVAETRNP